MPSPTPRVSAALIARRAAALVTYNDLHASDGVTPTAWYAASDELHVVAYAMYEAGCSTDEVRFVMDRSRDAAHEAVGCERRLAAAISGYTGLQATEGRRAVCS